MFFVILMNKYYIKGELKSIDYFLENGWEAEEYQIIDLVNDFSITYDELNAVTEIVDQKPNQILMVGFNRRFAPVSVELNKTFSKITLSNNDIFHKDFSQSIDNVFLTKIFSLENFYYKKNETKEHYTKCTNQVYRA